MQRMHLLHLNSIKDMFEHHYYIKNALTNLAEVSIALTYPLNCWG